MNLKKIIAALHVIAAASLLSCDVDFETLRIVSCTPAGNATGVLPGSYVEIGFSSAVNRTDVEDGFSLKNSGGPVSGNFAWISPSSVRYTPSSPMSRNGRYVINLPRSIRDDEGNTMSSDFISEFYVGTDFVPPSVTSSTPASGSGAVTGINADQNIIINFSKIMNRGSVEKEFAMTPDVPGYFVWGEDLPGVPDSRVTYTLTSDMEYGKLYTFKVSGAAEDSSGNSLGNDYAVNFITGNDLDTRSLNAVYDWSLPAVTWSNAAPVHGISRNVTIGLTFSGTMDRQSVEKAFSMTPSVQGIFEWSSDTTVRFRPLKPLAPETKYQVSVETTAKGSNGLKLVSGYSVEIVTDAADSRYVRIGGVRGSNHDGDYATLAGTWPLIIDMGAGTPVNRSYYILVDFISNDSPLTPAVMNQYSIFDNVIVETFKGTAGTGELPASAYIAGIEWTGGSTVKIKISGMTNRTAIPAQVPALYRLKIAGGENGIKDTSENYMNDDLVIEFREAIP